MKDPLHITHPEWFTPEGYMKPLYEMHPTMTGRGLDKEGILIRTREPIFSCQYYHGAKDMAGHDVWFYATKNDISAFDFRPENESYWKSHEHKQFGLIHAVTWMLINEQLIPNRNPLAVERMHQMERIIQGEDIPKPVRLDDEATPF